MSVWKAIWAVIVGTFVAAALGMIFDYFRPAMLDPANYSKFMYPWFTAVPGLVSSIIVAMMLYGGARTASPAAGKPGAKGAKPQLSGKKGEAVPGMPTFDFDKAHAETAKPAAPVDPGAGSRPASAAPAPPATVPPQPPQEQKQ